MRFFNFNQSKNLKVETCQLSLKYKDLLRISKCTSIRLVNGAYLRIMCCNFLILIKYHFFTHKTKILQKLFYNGNIFIVNAAWLILIDRCKSFLFLFQGRCHNLVKLNKQLHKFQNLTRIFILFFKIINK